MKIALLASTFLPRIGGAEIVVHNLAKQLCAQGHDALVITWWGLWRDVWRRVSYPMIPLLPGSYTDTSRSQWLQGHGSSDWISFQIRMLQRWFKFDLWNIHMAYPAGMLVLPELKRLGVPIVSTCHGDDIFYRPEIEYTTQGNIHVRKAIYQSLEMSDAVTAISGSIRAEYIRQGLLSDRIYDVPNGTNVAQIKEQRVERARVRQEMGWPLDAVILLSVGRNHKQKGYALIPDILKQLAIMGRQVIWCVVGSGSDDVQRMAEDAGFHGVVNGVPPIVANSGGETFDLMPPTRLVKLYKAADVFVLPTNFESFGLVLVEAMASGLPIVTTRVEGCVDVVKDEVTGVLATMGNAQEIASAIRRVMMEPGLRENLVNNGLAAADQYEWALVAQRYLDCYQSTIAKVQEA